MPFLSGAIPVDLAGASPVTAPPFSVNTAETMLYCNNPEQLVATDLGDEMLGSMGHYLSWSYVTGSCQSFFAHLNNTGRVIGYGLQVVNPSESPVTITVTNTGLSPGPFGCWQTFFAGQAGPHGWLGQRTIAPGGVLWLLRADEAFGPGSIFNGVVRFSIQGGYAYVLNYAYQDFNRLNGHATYQGFIRRQESDSQNEARVYKGTAPGFFVSVPLRYQVSAMLNRALCWRTHACTLAGNGSSAMRAFCCPAGPPSNPGDALQFSCSTGDNLGNWGVQYGYDLDLYNDTAETVLLQLGVRQPSPIANVYVVTPDGHGGRNIGASGWCFYTSEFSPGARRRVPYQVVLCGGSNGALENCLAVREVLKVG